MTLAALQHLIHYFQSLAPEFEVLVLGSASLLASHAELGDPSGPLTATFDADLCPQPFHEPTALLIHQALGEAGAFHLDHGYHADILRDSIFETLPPGWRSRLVPVPGCLRAAALDPHDLAAVKLLVARPKDILLVSDLARRGLLAGHLVKQRLNSIERTEALIVTSSRAFTSAFPD